MSPDSEYLSSRRPVLRGGVWGSLAVFPFFLSLADLIRTVVDHYGGNARTILPLWAWILGIPVVSVLLGGILSSARTVLMIVSLLLGILMFPLSLHLFEDREQFLYPVLAIMSELCVGCCFVTYCYTASRNNLLTWLRHSLLIKVLLFIALTANLVCVQLEFYQPVSSVFLLFVLTPWACVMLARQVQKTAFLEKDSPAGSGEESENTDLALPDTKPRA